MFPIRPPQILKSITECDLYWLAGIFEGEASFAWHIAQKLYGHPVVRIGMTDLDIVRRVQSFLGGSIYLDPPTRDGYKPQYRMSWQGNHGCEIMEMLLPLMGERRTQAITRCVSQWRVRQRPSGNLGEHNLHAKLTPAKVVAIRARYAAGNHSLSALGREFGVSANSVGHVVKRRSWKHIP